jgi:hypothetical protein
MDHGLYPPYLPAKTPEILIVDPEQRNRLTRFTLRAIFFNIVTLRRLVLMAEVSISA